MAMSIDNMSDNELEYSLRCESGAVSDNEGGDLRKELIQDDNGEESCWSGGEESILKVFHQQHPKLLKQDERGRKTRDKLWSELRNTLKNKFTGEFDHLLKELLNRKTFMNVYSFSIAVEEIQLKLLDVQGKWRAEDIDIVITHFRQTPSLWDSSLVEYRNRTGRNVSLEQLSRKIGYRKTAAEILSKFENLRTTFQEKTKKGKTGEEGKKAKPWPYLQDLMFLRKVGIQRKSFTNSLTEGCQEGDLVIQITDEGVDQESPRSGGSTSQDIFNRVGIKRKQRPRILEEEQSDTFKNKLLKCLEDKPDGLVAFGMNVAESLRKFSSMNQEFVKTQIQYVLAISMQKQSKEDDMPVFTPL